MNSEDVGKKNSQVTSVFYYTWQHVSAVQISHRQVEVKYTKWTVYPKPSLCTRSICRVWSPN